MPNLLISGPAGAGKSQRAVRRRRALRGAAVVVDFQALYAALTGDERAADGSYPHRDEQLLPIAEAMRLEAIDQARERDIAVIATNSDGDRDRRGQLLQRLGLGSEELVVDPGREVVESRLTDDDGHLDDECRKAIERWYGRL